MSSNVQHDRRGETTGILYAGSAYAFWGITPLYWRLLGEVPPFQLTTHRVLWCAIFVAIVTLWRGRLAHIVTIVRTPKLLATLALTSILISTNWTIFIYCVATNQLVESSLGYYLTPLLSIALGVFLFGEHMTRFRLAGVVLAAIAVSVKAFALGHVPWIAFSLALDPMDGLLIETALLLPFTLGLVIYWGMTEPHAFPAAGVFSDALLILAGPITAVPLALFAAGARRIRMTTLGFLQYFTPSFTLALATLGFHEPFGGIDAISFAFVWLALLIVALEGRFRPQLATQEGG